MLRTNRQGPTVASIRKAIQQGLDRPDSPAPSTSLSSRTVHTAPDLFEQANVNFTEKKWVWVPHEKEGYIAGYVVKEEANGAVVVHLMTGRDVAVNINDTEKVNPPKFEKVEDMADLGYLNEASVVHNLKQRYASNMIYTYSGLFLVAVNPYYNLQIYGAEYVAAYKNKKRNEVTPHIFSIADAAFHDMLHSKENQSILITGESGAGKTENTKKVIQYLTAIASDHKAQSGLTATGRSLEQQILSANPILESFGNAQTIRNNNSSRFGKFIRIEFNLAGQIAGANIEWYLFEKPRVTSQSKQERNYHVFYQFMKGASKAVKDKLLIDKGPEGYTFTRKCRQTIQGVDDRVEYETLVQAMETTGFSAEDQSDLFRILAAILHLGNMQFQATRNDEAVLREQVAAEKVCHVLGIQLSEFMRALLRPSIRAGRDWVTQSRTQQQVELSVEALGRSMYERMFGALVSRINAAMNRPDGKSTFIGVLDIAGFEILETNSFEQMCINYTNERLQQFFNRTMFVLEQEEYTREGIEWNFIDFGMDLQPTIDLIDRTKPIGIMSCLDEECVMPRATDKTFTEKLHGLWANRSDKYEVPRFAMGFTIKHYASQVEYSTEGWLEKNKDPLNENVTRLLGNSTEPFVAQLYADYADGGDGSGGSGDASGAGSNGRGARVPTTLKRGAFRTVAQRHKDQLNLLMAQLNSTQPHFVRCILPNSEKRAGKVDTPLVLDQLRCNGVLEGIRITRQGFPNRIPFPEFRQRYEILAPNTIPRQVFVDSKQAASLLLDALEMDAEKYRLGHTKVFFRAGVLAELEEIRDVELSKIIVQFQAMARGALSRSRFRRRIEQAKAIRVIQRNARVYNQLSEWPWWKLYRTVKPLLHVTRIDEEMRKRESRITELETLARTEAEERQNIEAERHELEREKARMEALLNSERSVALDQEEILKRTQEREMVLAESLREHTARLEELEEQYAAMAKAKAEAEAAMHSMESETVAMRDLASQHDAKDQALVDAEAKASEYCRALEDMEMDYAKTVERIGSMEARLGAAQSNEAQLETDIAQLRAALEERDVELETRTTAERELERVSQQASADLAKLQTRAEEAEADARDMREALERGSHKLTTAEQALDGAQQEKQRLTDANTRLARDVDELRQLIDEKADQGTRESELRRMREDELKTFRDELRDVSGELADFRTAHVEAEEALRGEIEQLRRERDDALAGHSSLEESYKSVEAQLHEHEARMEELEGTNMHLESQLTEAANLSRDIESQFTDSVQSHDNAVKERDELRKRLAAVEAQHAEATDPVEAQHAEATDRLSQAAAAADQALADHKDTQQGLAEAQKTVGELRAQLEENESMRDSIQQRITVQAQEYEDLKEKYNQDAVARMRQLEEANQEAFAELDDMRSGYREMEVRSAEIEKARATLAAEAEQLHAEVEGARAHALELEQANGEFNTQHDALISELQAARDSAQRLTAELEEQKRAAEVLRSSHSETEVRLRDLQVQDQERAVLETKMDELRKQLETKSSTADHAQEVQTQLETQLDELRKRLESEVATAEHAQEVKTRLETQHKEMQDKLHQELAAKDTQAEESRKQLLQELKTLGERLDQEVADRERADREKSQLDAELQRAQQAADSSTRVRDEAEDARRELSSRLQKAEVDAEALRKAVEDYQVLADRHEKRANTLHDSLQERDMELAQVSRRLQRSERRLEEVMAQAAYHLDARNRLDGENVELREKLDDAYRQLGRADTTSRSLGASDTPSGGAVRKLEAQAEERIHALEDARQSLAASLQAAQREAEDKQHELIDLDRSFGLLQDELAASHASLLAAERERDEARDTLASLKEQLESERSLRGNNEELSNSLSAKLEALREALASAEGSARDASEQRDHIQKLVEAARAEAGEAQAARDEAVAERDAAEESVHRLESQALELQSRLDDAELASAELGHMRDGLQRELDAIGSRHRGDYDTHGRVLDELRGKYQNELEATTGELETVKRDHVELREAYISLDSTLALRSQELDRANEDAADARRELQRVMSKLEELAPAYESARDAAKARETELDSARHERDSAVARAAAATALHDDLRTARDKLEARLDEVQAKYIEASQGRQTAEKAALQLEDEIRSARARLAEIDDDQSSADERVARLDAIIADVHLALDKEREANTILTKDKNVLERQLKEQRLRIVKLETEAVASQVSGSPSMLPVPAADLSSRIESQAKATLEHQQKAKQLERQIRELQFQIGEREKSKQRSEIDTQRLTSRIKRLETHVKELESSEHRLAAANHRLERELGSLRTRTASPAFS
ncbi:class II myosin [Coemansia sp. RSA 1365]|nr:class II myosin [Coemansia sp. RSA 1365]